MDERERARRLGRRAGIVLFSVIVATFTGVLATQIILQVWAPDVVETPYECRPGIRALQAAVERARTSAAEATEGERDALRRFRMALQPEWTARPALGEKCARDPESTRALVTLDKLRYAEEHAVRYEATSLAALRRIAENGLGPPAQPTPR